MMLIQVEDFKTIVYTVKNVAIHNTFMMWRSNKSSPSTRVFMRVAMQRV